jgi:hypothetical protein
MSKVQIPEDKSSAIVMTDSNGTIRYLNEFGQLHRNGDLPAMMSPTESIYYKNGLIHRENGPAVIRAHQQCYYKNGVLHRDGDLPAIINSGNIGEDQKIYSEVYYKHGQIHRDDGPAMMWSTGSYKYFKHDKVHNDAGPACHWVDNGQSRDEYWLNGEMVSKIGHKIASLRNNVFSQTNHKKHNM